jgi:hypothetical protein
MDEIQPNAVTPNLELPGLPPDHAVAKLWPRMSGAEKDRICKSIKKGIPETVYVWTDPAGKDWLVYGRERAELWVSLVEDHDIDPTKTPLRMANLGPLTEHEMIEHVVFSLNRGWGRPGQRAVIAVLANRLLSSAHPEKDSTGDQAQALADKLGVSRPLIFEAKRLVEERPDLAQDVLKRRLNLHPAYFYCVVV